MTLDFISLDISRYFKLEESKGVNNKGEEMRNKKKIIPDNGKFLAALRAISSVFHYEKAEGFLHKVFI